MDSSKQTIVQLNTGVAHSQLQFQDFELNTENGETGAFPTSPSTSYSFPGSSDGAENEDLLGGEPKPSPSFWELSYYQQFFDVDTNQVVDRILYSFIPTFGRASFLDRYIRPKPDLYGPFWIVSTLVIISMVGGALRHVLDAHVAGQPSMPYNFDRAMLTACIFYSYVFLLPIFIWLILWFRIGKRNLSLLEITCLYGYSVSIFVPAALLSTFPWMWIQIISLIVTVGLSGTVLVHSFWKELNDLRGGVKYIMAGLIFAGCFLAYCIFLVYMVPTSTNLAPPFLSTSAAPISSNITTIVNNIVHASEAPSAGLKSLALLKDNSTNKILMEQTTNLLQHTLVQGVLNSTST